MTTVAAIATAWATKQFSPERTQAFWHMNGILINEFHLARWLTKLSDPEGASLSTFLVEPAVWQGSIIELSRQRHIVSKHKQR